MNPTKNTLGDETREAMIKLLQARLADAIDLWTHAKGAHWNVKGPNFIALHELFDEVAELLDGAADDLAERMVQLGGSPQGTARAVAKTTSLKEYPSVTSGRDHCDALSTSLADFGGKLVAAIDAADEAGDKDTADLFTEISREIDKKLWFVEAHLQD